MLFDPTIYEKIAAQAARLNDARESARNHWCASWDSCANAIPVAYEEAMRLDTPDCWRRICDLAAELRMEMTKTDGQETTYFVGLVILTDLIETSIVQARAKPQNLIVQKELGELKERAIQTREEIEAEQRRTPATQSEKLDRLGASDEKFKQTVVNINILSGVSLNVSNINVDIGGAAKKASESVIDKATKIVKLVNEGVKLLNNEMFTGTLKQAVAEVSKAAGRFADVTIRRFRAMRLPEPDFDDGPPRDRIQVRVYPPDREEVRWIRPGGGKNTAEVFWDTNGGPEMVVVPAGKFMMGSPDEEPESSPAESPRHEVTFAQPFAVGRHAVTRGQFAAFVKATGHKIDDQWRKPGFRQADNHPVVCVNWDDAKAYASWLAEVSGRPYRLLTEAEWEYVARAGTVTPFWWGSSMTSAQANYDGNFVYKGGGDKGKYRQGTVPVDSFEQNPWGLYNVHGNVWEWCEDTWHDNYKGAPVDGSAWVPKQASRSRSKQPSSRVVRGGSWDVLPRNLRSAQRDWYTTGIRYSNIGFRLARTLTS